MEVDTRRQMGGRNGGRHQEKNVGYICRRNFRRNFRQISAKISAKFPLDMLSDQRLVLGHAIKLVLHGGVLLGCHQTCNRQST